MPKCEVCGGFAFSDMANICIKCKNEAELRVVRAESALRKTICPRDQQDRAAMTAAVEVKAMIDIHHEAQSLCAAHEARIAELEEDVEYMDRKRFENRAFAIRYRKRYLAAQKRIAELEAQLNAACRETQDVFSGMICSKCGLPQGTHGIDGGTGMCWSCRERTAPSEVDELRAKLDQVRSEVGCARGQRTTQYCADLERTMKERDELQRRLDAVCEMLERREEEEDDGYCKIENCSCEDAWRYAWYLSDRKKHARAVAIAEGREP